MIKPNWNIFKAKFSENPHDNFEWFCYSLFCKEFKQEKGIFRFKNQSAIETNSIKYENDIIGWQAKFYDTPLSNHKDELLQTLEKAKRDYPDITKIILYTNQEWGQNKGQKPQGLVEIEQKANELKIDLEQRTTSFFESPLFYIILVTVLAGAGYLIFRPRHHCGVVTNNGIGPGGDTGPIFKLGIAFGL